MPKDNLPNMEDKLRKIIRQIVPESIFGILSFGKLPRIRISVGKQTLSNKYFNDLKQDFVALNTLYIIKISTTTRTRETNYSALERAGIALFEP